jgi:hypothetical protein
MRTLVRVQVDGNQSLCLREAVLRTTTTTTSLGLLPNPERTAQHLSSFQYHIPGVNFNS